MRYYAWMREPQYQKWTMISSKKFAAAIKAGDKKLAMRIAALWEGKMILDPRYGDIFLL